MEVKIYVDSTDVRIDNRDLYTTELRYPNDPLQVILVVNIPFMLDLVEGALERAGFTSELTRRPLTYLKELLRKEKQTLWNGRT